MMKINKTENKKIMIVCIVLVVIFIVAAAKILNIWPFISSSNVNDANNTNQETTNESPKNNNKLQKADLKADANGDKTTDQISVNEGLSASIAELKQVDDHIDFTAEIKNATLNGTCTITFSNPNDRPVIKQVSSTLQNNIATCGPTSIPKVEFSYLGQWDVSLRYFVNDKQAVATGKIIIQ